MSRRKRRFFPSKEIPTVQESPSAAEVEETEAKCFWGSLRSWFLEKGYTLFELGKLTHSFPLLDTPSRDVEKFDYPYAFCGGDPPFLKSLAAEPLEAYYSDKVCFAQDTQGRHVAIKKLGNTDETRICRFLFEKRDLLAENCILPILEILEHEENRFAVMPRWGDNPCFPDSGSIGNVLHYIHCLLKAIHFLHSNSIVHRDLKEDNTLVNHFGAYRCNKKNMMRPKLRTAGQLTYVLFDFDLSLMLPSPACRLPSSRSVEIFSIVWPYDTSHGELDYDPYKFEMGCLGIILCQKFQPSQHCIPAIPFLAPLFDRLITDQLELRFTSYEALRFFEEMCAKLDPKQLSLEAPVDTASAYPPWEPGEYDRWEGLPSDFVQEWEHFKAPIPSIYTKFVLSVSSGLGAYLAPTDPSYWEHPLEAYYSDKVYFAQDSQGWHVGIKKLNKPDEIKIYRFLFKKRKLLPRICILPVLELFEFEQYCLAVMPQWGEDV
ncbi:hypothetical protein Clacol_002177 [Clathrus columnatus]|uniref:Protein kinase domain-containing protein n=1 Tax=Clathrus columnatus TaxID=1419009 RepID=A0AAV5A4M7_9AGAM|nr:hypothetical protein Clacol_002177 [Clathrus columnatus]